MLHCSFFFR